MRSLQTLNRPNWTLSVHWLFFMSLRARSSHDQLDQVYGWSGFSTLLPVLFFSPSPFSSLQLSLIVRWLLLPVIFWLYKLTFHFPAYTSILCRFLHRLSKRIQVSDFSSRSLVPRRHWAGTGTTAKIIGEVFLSMCVKDKKYFTEAVIP